MADTFNITAAGATYQWQVNPGSGWSNLADTGVYSGALTNTLTITAPATTLNGYNYRCQLTTLVGGCTSNSNSAGLTVNPIPNNPTLYLDNMPNDTAHYCVSGPGVVIKLSPTQSSSFSYDLQSYPAGASISNLTGNNGALLFPAQPWGQYQIIITNTGTTCAILKLQ